MSHVKHVAPEFDRVSQLIEAGEPVRFRRTARVQELRRSNAAGLHRTARTTERGSRSNARKAAVADNRNAHR